MCQSLRRDGRQPKTIIQEESTTFSHYHHEKSSNLIQNSYWELYLIASCLILSLSCSKWIPIHFENKCFGFWFPASHHLGLYNMTGQRKTVKISRKHFKIIWSPLSIISSIIISNMTKKMTSFQLNFTQLSKPSFLLLKLLNFGLQSFFSKLAFVFVFSANQIIVSSCEFNQSESARRTRDKTRPLSNFLLSARKSRFKKNFPRNGKFLINNSFQ